MRAEEERKSFDEYYHQYYSIVCGYINKKVNDRSVAEDLAADVFLNCYKHFEGFDPEKASFSTWLFVIVNNRLKNHYRDKKIVIDIDAIGDRTRGVIGDSIMMHSMILSEMRAQIANALSKISDDQKQAVVLKYFDELSGREIAEKMGISESNVRVLIYRALKAMQRYVKI